VICRVFTDYLSQHVIASRRVFAARRQTKAGEHCQHNVDRRLKHRNSSISNLHMTTLQLTMQTIGTERKAYDIDNVWKAQTKIPRATTHRIRRTPQHASQALESHSKSKTLTFIVSNGNIPQCSAVPAIAPATTNLNESILVNQFNLCPKNTKLAVVTL
jgi:hypothetical protein